MFDLTKLDTFHSGDVVISFPKDDDPRERLEQFSKLGLEVWAFSRHGTHKQYLLVPDIAERQAIALASDRNSAGGIYETKLIKPIAEKGFYDGKIDISALPGKSVV